MLDLKKLNERDPLKRLVEKQTDQEEFSPMDPPDAFSPPAQEALRREDLPPLLTTLVEQHDGMRTALAAFEDALHHLKESRLPITSSVRRNIQQFFQYLDNQILPHQRTEEALLFRPLQPLLLEKGDHSRGQQPVTAVDLLEDDHLKMMQLAAVTFNLMGLVHQLPDPTSQTITLQAAIDQGMVLVEMLRLHLFREEHVLFPLAVRYLQPEWLNRRV